jgi:hypothetical protein
MKRISLIFCLALFAASASAQLDDAVRSVLETFPYNRKSDAIQALRAMDSWNGKTWRGFFRTMENDTLLGRKSVYAWDAFLHESSRTEAGRKKALDAMAEGMAVAKSAGLRQGLITSAGNLGDDAAVGWLAKELKNPNNGADAAMALAVIGSPMALKALEKSIATAPLSVKPQIEASMRQIRRNGSERYTNPPPDALTEDEKRLGFEHLFDGGNLDRWTGDKKSYVSEGGSIVVRPNGGSGGNLYTVDTYGDFELRFSFKLTPGANNGLGIRTPKEGDAAYVGMELQILDNEAPKYKSLKPYQYHGSVYGVMPAKRGHQLPVGQWNHQTVVARGNRITVILNGVTILDGDIAEASRNGTMDGNKHPGLLNKSGHIGFLGHGDEVAFRNVRIRRL